MYNVRDILSSVGRPVDDITLTTRLRDWESEVFEKISQTSSATDPAVRFGGTVPLHLLRPDDQIEMMGKYRDIIGLNTVLGKLANVGPNQTMEYLASEGFTDSRNREISNIWSNLTGERSLSTDSPYGRFRGLGDDSMLNRIYSSINLQFYNRPRRSKSGNAAPSNFVSDHFGVGSIQRVGNIEKPNLIPEDLAGTNIMTFDIETAGFRPGSIREIAYETMNYGDRSTRMAGTVILRPSQGQRGTMMSGGRRVNLDEFLTGATATTRSSGDEFLAQVMPFIERARQSDYIIGHNIESFDISQIFQGIAGTQKYKTDAAFRADIDTAFSDISSKTVDTLRLARQAPNLAGLTSAIQDVNGRGGPYSIENLMLRTDLAKRIGIERIAGAMGYDQSTGVFSKGLHFGDVDTLVTTGLLENLRDLRQVDMLDAGFTPAERKIAELVRSQVVKSAAVTPFTNIRETGAIHPRILRMLGPNASVNPIEQEVLLQRRLSLQSASATARVNAGIPTRELMSTIGGFDRFIKKGDMSYGDFYENGLKPGNREFNEYRKVLRSKGFGFAGLSYEERLFGTALSSMTSKVADKGYARFAKETLVSRFKTFDPTTIQYLTESGKVTLPPQLLREMGLIDRGTLLDLSVVEATGKTNKASVNLAYKFSGQEDIEKAISVMGDINQGSVTRFAEILGIDPNSDVAKASFGTFQEAMGKGEFVDALRKTGTSGVSIGQIFGEDSASDDIVEFLRQVNAQNGKLRDDRLLNFRLPFMNMAEDEGVIRTAGAVLDVGLRDRDAALISREVAKAEQLYNPTERAIDGIPTKPLGRGFAGLATAGPRTRMLASHMETAASDSSVSRAMRAFEFVDQKIVPKVPRLGLAAIASGIAVYAFARKRENDKYDVAFDYAGPEPGPSRYALADVLEARMAAGQNEYSRQIDPLATASLTEHLYYGSIGHTNMSWDRSNAIYGGVL